MSKKAAEQKSQHFDAPQSLGPVGKREHVILAVFDQAASIGQDITRDHFENGRLNQANESVARLYFTPKSIFESFVAPLNGAPPRKLRGVSTAEVKTLRAIPIPLEISPGNNAVHVLSKVEVGDDDGHAVLAYSDAVMNLSVNNGRKCKPVIRKDIARSFGKIVKGCDVRWPMLLLANFRRWVARKTNGRDFPVTLFRSWDW